MKAVYALCLAAVLTIGAVSSSAQTEIRSYPPEGFDGEYPLQFGLGINFPVPGDVVGQTFVAPADYFMQDFSIGVAQLLGTYMDLRGYVSAWDGSKASGPLLFTSELRRVYQGDTLEMLTFDTGGLSLSPGGNYVMFLQAVNGFDEYSQGQPEMGFASIGSATGYMDGRLFYAASNGDLSNLTTVDWGMRGDDLAFRASFSSPGTQPITPVPEPSTYGLMGAGALLGLGAVRRLRRKAGARS